jgi:hypothetical protein
MNECVGAMQGAVILMEFRFRAELPSPDNSKFDLTTTAPLWHSLIGFRLICFCPFFALFILI